MYGNSSARTGRSHRLLGGDVEDGQRTSLRARLACTLVGIQMTS
jgi:hypothetical protein